MRDPSDPCPCPEDCAYCSGELCMVHGYQPCECDVSERHDYGAASRRLGVRSLSLATLSRLCDPMRGIGLERDA